ncbi:Major DNA-binding protein, partial [Bienertia sinuspersici]
MIEEEAEKQRALQERKALKRERFLNIRQGPKIGVGDYVWLSLNAQKIYGNKMKDKGDVEEGPFKVVHHENFNTYQVSLGQGVVASISVDDL